MPGSSARKLVISDFVEQGAAAGDPTAAGLRLASIADLTAVPTEASEIEHLAKELITAGALPTVAHYDALHIAAAAYSGIRYLVTWNYAHLANPQNLDLVEAVCRKAGFEPPRIVTPDQLFIGSEGVENVD